MFSKKVVTDIWPAADIRLATNTDIPKFAYRYICRSWCGLLTAPAYGSLTKLTNLTEQKVQNKT